MRGAGCGRDHAAIRRAGGPAEQRAEYVAAATGVAEEADVSGRQCAGAATADCQCERGSEPSGSGAPRVRAQGGFCECTILFAGRSEHTGGIVRIAAARGSSGGIWRCGGEHFSAAGFSDWPGTGVDYVDRDTFLSGAIGVEKMATGDERYDSARSVNAQARRRTIYPVASGQDINEYRSVVQAGLEWPIARGSWCLATFRTVRRSSVERRSPSLR